MVERIRRTVETKDGGFDAIEGIMLFSIECLWMDACGGLIVTVFLVKKATQFQRQGRD